jgi:hypothetical protein
VPDDSVSGHHLQINRLRRLTKAYLAYARAKGFFTTAGGVAFSLTSSEAAIHSDVSR